MDHFSQKGGNENWVRWQSSDETAMKSAISRGFLVQRTAIRKGDSVLQNDETVSLFKSPLKAADEKTWMAAAEIKPELNLIYQWLSKADKTPQSKTEWIQQTKAAQLEFLLVSSQLFFNFDGTLLTGLGMIDRTAEKDVTYLYTVFENSEETRLVGSTVVNMQSSKAPAPIISNHEEVAEVHINTNNHRFAGYFVERAIADTGYFYRIFNKPLLATSQLNQNGIHFQDTLSTQGLRRYRVIGIDEFGILSIPSDTIIVEITAPLPLVSITTVTGQTADKFSIQTDLSTQASSRPFVYSVYVSDSLSGDYRLWQDSILDFKKQILPLPTTAYLKINVRNHIGREKSGPPFLFQKTDSIAPQAPSISESRITKDGIMQLIWQKHNYKEQIKFNVYLANRRKQEYSLLNNAFLQDTSFTDTISLNMLRDSIFIGITALDNRYNESAKVIIALKVPDIIPPAVPAISNYLVLPNSITFTCLTPNAKDIKTYFVKRRTDNDSVIWQMLAASNNDPFLFVDSTGEKEKNYTYSIAAEDADGNRSAWSAGITLKFPDFNRELNPITPNILEDKQKKQVLLLWDFAANSRLSHFRIFEAKPGQKYKTVAVVAADARHCILNMHSIPEGTKYIVQPCLNNGL